MDELTVKLKLKDWIVERSKISVTVAELGDDTPIVDGGYLSSLDIVEFILYIESLLGDELDLDELEPEMFTSTNTMYQTFFASA